MSDTNNFPPPDGDLPSGRFLLRLAPALHGRIRDSAERLGISLNEYCNRILAAPGSGAMVPATEVILRALDQFGEALLGVIAYGSWAREELADRSDIDLLVVVSSEIRLTRALYREWDTEPVTWDTHEVEPQFAHLPTEGATLSGTWAEVALEGIVLLDRDLLISRRLIEIRHRISQGEIVRRTLNGQPYWVRVA